MWLREYLGKTGLNQDKEPSLGEQLDLSEPLEVAKHHGGEGRVFS